MADTVELKIGGLTDLTRALESLKNGLRRRTIRAALRDAARPIVRQAKALAPRRSGLMRRKIAVRSSRRDNGRQGVIGVYLNVRPLSGAQREQFKKQSGKQARANPNDPFYWRFLEFGTRRMRPRRFLVPAFEAHQREAVEIFSARLVERIEQANRTGR